MSYWTTVNIHKMSYGYTNFEWYIIMLSRDNRITSALYILINPLLTLLQAGTPLILYNWFECSANGPLFTFDNTKQAMITIHTNTMSKTSSITVAILPLAVVVSSANLPLCQWNASPFTIIRANFLKSSSLMLHLTYYKSFRRQSSQPITWLVQKPGLPK